MAKFTFKGRERGGGEITGTRSADSAQALVVALRQENIMMVEAKEKKGFDLSKIEFGGNPTPKDLAIFTRQFSVMIDSGLPLVQCLEILGSQQENPKFAEAVKTIQREVETGNTLSEGMRMSPKYSTSCTRTWSQPEKRAVFSTPSFNAYRSISKRPSN